MTKFIEAELKSESELESESDIELELSSNPVRSRFFTQPASHKP